MFYKQTIVDTELVILTLDGGLLDLNRSRYNYFKRLCAKQNREVQLSNFVDNLGCYKTMYNDYTLDYDAIDEVIEKDLFSYVNLKQNIKKEGVIELLQFLKQKRIKVAVLSSHKTRQAIGYLQMVGIYDFVDFIVGGDTDFDVFPSNEVLLDICNQMNVNYKKALVVANYPSVLKAANEAFMNVVYVHDMVEYQSNESNAFEFVRTYLEVLNLFLFSKYDDIEMYSEVLGMSKDMDLESLKCTYKQLLQEYQNDDQLIEIVKRSYKFYLLEISNDSIKNQQQNDSISTGRLAAFEDANDESFDLTTTFTEKDLPDISPLLPESFSKDAMQLSQLVDKINQDSSKGPINEVAPIQQSVDKDLFGADLNTSIINTSIEDAINSDKIQWTNMDLKQTISPKVVEEQVAVNKIEAEPIKKVIPTGGIEWTDMNLNESIKPEESISSIKQPINMDDLEKRLAIANRVEQVDEKSKGGIFSKKSRAIKKQDKLQKQNVDSIESTSLDFDFIRKDKIESANTVQPIEINTKKMDQSGTKIKEVKKEKKPKVIVDKNSTTEMPKNPVSIISNLMYESVLSLIVILLCMLSYMCLKDFLDTPSFIANLINNLSSIYIMIGEFMLSVIFNTLSIILDFIPNYELLIQGNDYLSGLAILIIWFTFIGVFVSRLLKKGIHKLILQVKLEYGTK